MSLVQYRSDDELLGVLTDLSGADVLGDDVLGEEAEEIDQAAEEYFTPEIEGEIDDMANEAILLGYADDPELMGSVLSKFVKKVAKRIKKRMKGKAPRARALSIPTAATPTEEGPAGLLKNPLVLLALAGGALLLLSKKRKKAA